MIGGHGDYIKSRQRFLSRQLQSGFGQNQKFYKYLRENNLTIDELDFEIIYNGVYEIKLKSNGHRYCPALIKLEGEFQKEFKPKCNTDIAGRTKEEYNKYQKAGIKGEFYGDYRKTDRDFN